jgi:hypothetical protein
MKKKKSSEPKKKQEPKVNKELEGFDIKINSFGEIISTHSIEKINQFLNKHVDDKKLRDRSKEDLEAMDKEMGDEEE